MPWPSAFGSRGIPVRQVPDRDMDTSCPPVGGDNHGTGARSLVRLGALALLYAPSSPIPSNLGWKLLDPILVYLFLLAHSCFRPALFPQTANLSAETEYSTFHQTLQQSPPRGPSL